MAPTETASFSRTRKNKNPQGWIILASLDYFSIMLGTRLSRYAKIMVTGENLSYKTETPKKTQPYVSNHVMISL